MSDIDKTIQEFIDNMKRLTHSLANPNMTTGYLAGRMIKILQEMSVIGEIVKLQEERLKKVEDTEKL